MSRISGLSGLRKYNIVFISHSLGSRIIMDALGEIVDTLGRAQTVADSPALVADLQEKEISVFMLSNQLAFLQIGLPAPNVFGQIDGYVEEVADLARQCAIDVQDLRALLDAVALLGTRQDEDAIVAGPEPVPFTGRARAPDAADRAPVDTDEAGRTPAELESIRRRAALRALARQQGGDALDELADGLAAIEGRLDEMSRSGALWGGTGPAPAGERTPVGVDRGPSIGARLTAIEERLTALERRMRWSEEPPGGDSGA